MAGSAECVVAPLTPRLTVPEAVKAAGYEYFLEIDGVHEVLEVFDQSPGSTNADGRWTCRS